MPTEPSTTPRGRLVSFLLSARDRVDCGHLLRHGYQVFPCLSSDEADDICAALDAEVALSGERFPPDRVGRHGSGHWQSVWRAREAGDPLFRSLFGEEALHAFDAFVHTVESKQRKLWMHIDQPASNANAFDSLQGLLALRDVPADGYATAVCHCDDLQALLNDFQHAFVQPPDERQAHTHPSRTDARVHFFSEREVAWLVERTQIVRPPLKRGELLVWCAGVPHCAYGGAWQRRGVFLSALPRSLCSEDELEMRRDAARRGLTSNHDVVCRAANGGVRLSLRGGVQTWPRRLPPMASYDSPTNPTQRRRACMLGFDVHASDAMTEELAATPPAAESGRAGGRALVLLDALIADVSHARS